MPRGFSGGGMRPTASLFQVRPRDLGEKIIPEVDPEVMEDANEVGLADWVDGLLDISDISAQTGLSDSAFLTAQKGNGEATAATALTQSPPKELLGLESGSIWGAIDPTQPIEGFKPEPFKPAITGTKASPLDGQQKDNPLLSWMEKIFKGDEKHQQHEQQKKEEQQKKQEQQQQQEQQRQQQQVLQLRGAQPAAPSLTSPIEHGEQVLEFNADTRITAVLSDGAFGYSHEELVSQSLLDLAYTPQRQELYHALQVLHRMGEIQNMMVAGIGGAALPRQSIRCIHHVIVRVQQRVQLLAMDTRITLVDSSCSPAKLLLRSKVLGPPDCVASFRMVPN